MARKGKIGIEYFSHDVDIMQDRRVKILKAKHGLLGYAVYMRLLEEIYRENGYYIKIDEEFNILFSDECNLDYNVYILMLNDCIKNSLFDSALYENYSILTSKRIQLNYCEATQRRKEIQYIDNYLLVDINSLYSDKINVDIISLNVDINKENANIGTQSKKKVKQNETENENETETEIKYSEIFECWNSNCNGNSSRSLTSKITSAINGLVSDTITIEEMKLTIVKYWNVVKDENSWYSHKFNLLKFLKQPNGLREFIEKDESDYKNKNNFNNKPKLGINKTEGIQEEYGF